MSNALRSDMEALLKQPFARQKWLDQFKQASTYLARVKSLLGSAPELKPEHIEAFELKNINIEKGDLSGFYHWIWCAANNGIASVDRAALHPEGLKNIREHIDCQGLNFGKIHAKLMQDHNFYDLAHQWLAGWKLRGIGYEWAVLPQSSLNRFVIGLRPDLLANVVSMIRLKEICNARGIGYTEETTWLELNLKLVKAAGLESSADPDFIFKRSIAFYEMI